MANSEQMGFFVGDKLRWGVDTSTYGLVPLESGYAIGTASRPVAIQATTLALATGMPTGATLLTTTKGATWKLFFQEEEVTLSTAGATTDTTNNVLPANSLILYVSGIVTTTITTATDWKFGDSSTADRFTSANSTMTAGTAAVFNGFGFDGSKAAGYNPWQASAAKLRITTTGTPGAGKVRVTVVGFTFSAPTS